VREIGRLNRLLIEGFKNKSNNKSLIMNNRRYLLLIMMTVLTFCGAQAQRRISGNVTDGTDSLYYATVMEIDRKNRIVSHTSTDMDGNFSMTIKNPKNYLKVEYVGYIPYKEKIRKKTRFNIKLKERGWIRCY